ncbi:MAG: amino acid permease [Acidiferrobacterales bacterium]|nr:amino acid permease [Acidiferrobacterales bacterium]
MSEKTVPLDRSISLFQATIYGVGIILGAGIYALIGEAAGLAGNRVWLSFVLAAFIAACSAVSYAELSSVYPKSAAEFVYVKAITGSPFAGFMIGYFTVLTGVISVAVVALGFSSYFKLYLDVHPVLVGILVIVAAAVLNASGIQKSARVNAIFTLIEVSGLIFIIVIGASFIGEVNLLAAENEVNSVDFSGAAPIFSAAALVFFAYIGFEDIVNIAEETRNPEKNVPLAVLYSLVITTVIYILVAIVAVSVVPSEMLSVAASLDNPTEGPLALVASRALDSPMGGQLFTVVALCATANTVLVLHIVTSRMMYGMARERCLPSFLGRVHRHTHTPINAVILSTILCGVFTLSGSLSTVAKLTNVGVFAIFLLVNLMLLMQRFQSRNRSGQDYPKLKLAINIGWFPVLPFIGLIFCFGMLVTQFWEQITFFGWSISIIGYGGVIAAMGFPLYLITNLSARERIPGN